MRKCTEPYSLPIGPTGRRDVPRPKDLNLGRVQGAFSRRRFLRGSAVRILLTGILTISMCGCGSIRTSMWTRAEDESLHPDMAQNLKGIPVMLKVPSHIEVKITERLYAAHVPEHNRLEVVRLKRPDLSVAADLKYTEKMFLVDPVQVCAGSGEFGFGFGPLADGDPTIHSDGMGSPAGHGYLHSANYKADDQTIAQAGELVKNVLNFPGVRSTSGGASPANLNLVTIDRVVAFRRFDLAANDCQQQVFDFLETQVNQCSCTERNFSPPFIEAPESPAAGGGSSGPTGTINIEFGTPSTPATSN